MRFSILLLAILFIFSACSQGTEKIEDKSSGTLPDFSITNLYDAFGKTQQGLTQDFGFSAIVKYNGKLILFDAGTNADILKANTNALGIDLSLVDMAVGSHAHGDHLNGFDYLLSVNPDVKIFLPADFFAGNSIDFNVAGKEESVRDSLPPHMQYFGGSTLKSTINQSGRFWNANVEYVNENMDLGNGIKLIFTRSPYLGYGSKYPSVVELEAMGVDKQAGDDEIKFAGLPELTLSLGTDSGEVVLVGCSHSSVQAIVQETQSFTNHSIELLYGGYHMIPYGREETLKVADQLKSQLDVSKIAPAHCTGHLAFKILQDTYGEDYIFAGLGETILFPSVP